MARKKSNIHYIYKTTCLITNRYYIGMHSTCNIDDGYMGSGKRLRYSIRKYGIENHKKEMVEFFETRELLIEAEKKAITPDMVLDKNCMNLKEGGTGGFSVEQQRLNGINSNKKQKILRETNPEWFAKVKVKMSISQKKLYDDGRRERKEFYNWSGLTHSEEAKRKIGKANSIKQKGGGNSQYGTCWITKNGVNKKIKKEEIDFYIKDNWCKGRKI